MAYQRLYFTLLLNENATGQAYNSECAPARNTSEATKLFNINCPSAVMLHQISQIEEALLYSLATHILPDVTRLVPPVSYTHLNVREI